jgi:OmpA-OmpF porin, OOP family
MTPGNKIVVGALVTAALASLFHGPLGYGKTFVDGLEGSANAKLSAEAGVVANTDRDSAYRRGVILSGPATDRSKKDALLAEVRAIPGMAWARWEGDDGAAGKAAAPKLNTDQTPATAAAVKDCQADLDTAIKGKTIQFESGTAALSVASNTLIDELSSNIGACAGTQIEVAGHTDLTGDHDHNQALSEARANAVVEAFLAKGVPTARLLPKGYGDTQPMMPGMSGEANAKNRRIEFHAASAK